MRFLTFKGGDPIAQRRYALIQLAFSNSARSNSPNDLATITDLIKAVNVVGVAPEDDDDDEQGTTDPDSVVVAESMRRLSDDGGKVKLESNEFKILKELVDQTKWRASFAPGITDLKEFLKNAPKDRKKAGEGDSTDDGDGAPA